MAGPSLAQGAVLGGDFVIVKLLGQGGMGAVYIAEQTSTGKLRALKVMHREMAPDATLQKRFEQEARVGGRIRSGHVVEVIAAGVDAERGLPFLVMELLDGIDLRSHLARAGALSPEEVGVIFEQLCHGVAAAHAAGVVHRDLKPENVFLSRPSRAGALESVVKVLDFGIAKLAAESGTQATAAVGSPLWMAPEQTTPGPVTPAADVWALGLMAYELLAGEHFWRSAAVPTAGPVHLLREILIEPIPEPSARSPRPLPPGFDAWFKRCVTRAPADRFQDAGELWRALQEVVPDPRRRPGSADSAGSAPPPRLGLGPDAFAPTAVAPSGGPLHATPLAMAPPATYPPEAPRVSAAPPAGPPRLTLAIGAVLAIGGVGLGLYLGRSHGTSSATLTVSANIPDTLLPSPSASAPPPAVPVEPVAVVTPPTPSAAPSATAPVRARPASGPSRPRDDDEPPPVPPAPVLQDGFSNPQDSARVVERVGSTVLYAVKGHHIRLMTRVVSNGSNVATSIVRNAIDHSSWQYLRCYEAELARATPVTDGTVTVAFDIENQLPRRAKLQGSTFSSPLLGDCVAQTLLGQTINAAGPEGVGPVVYGFRMVKMD